MRRFTNQGPFSYPLQKAAQGGTEVRKGAICFTTPRLVGESHYSSVVAEDVNAGAPEHALQLGCGCLDTSASTTSGSLSLNFGTMIPKLEREPPVKDLKKKKRSFYPRSIKSPPSKGEPRTNIVKKNVLWQYSPSFL